MRLEWLALTVILGCGDPAGDPTPADAGDVDDASGAVDVGGVGAVPDAGFVPVSCVIEVSGETAVRAGGRLVWTVQGDLPTDTLRLAGAGWRVAVSGDVMTLRAPYQPGTHTLTLSGDCPEGLGEVAVEVEVLPLAWASTPGWRGDGGPVAREYFSLWIDPTDSDRLWLFGGFHYRPRQFTTAWDLWSYDLVDGTWAEEDAAGEPPHLAGGGMAPAPDAATAYYYGGLNVTPEGGSQLPFSLYRFDFGDLTSWREQRVADAPGDGDYQPAFFYEPDRGVYLAIGGQGAAGTHMNVFAFDPLDVSWRSVALAPGPQPSGRTGFFWTYDPETRRFVAFAGEQGGGDPGDGGCNCAQDTWALELSEEPPRWVEVLPAQDPPIGRRNGAYALDPVGHRLFVWGGTADGRSSFPGLYALDLDRGHERWVEVGAVDPPPARASGAAVYDAARGRILAGFGNGADVYADLWSLRLLP